jgi:hypothetical protein
VYLAATSPRAGEAVLVASIKFKSKGYFLVLGPGNVRWGTNKEQLEASSLPGVNSGVPQTNAMGRIELEWQGDVYAISDLANTPVFVTFPAYEFMMRKGLPVARY